MSSLWIGTGLSTGINTTFSGTVRGTTPLIHDMPALRTTVLSIALLTILSMGIYPPWNQTATFSSAVVYHEKAYGWLVNPPYPNQGRRELWKVEIDVQRLLLQWLLVGAATAGLVWMSRHREAETRRQIGETMKKINRFVDESKKQDKA